MKAMFLTGHGGPDMLRLGEAEDPTPAPDEIVVNVHAASVNAADYKVRLGGQGHSVRFPHILGRDFSGVVAATGAEVSDFKAGDPVFGVNDAGKEGAYAEKLAIRAAIVARKPERLSHLQAAAMALTGITAIWAIEDTAQLRAGETILIQGGAGGVAGFAIQLAKYLGATVVTTTSAANVDYLRGLGADRVVDYNAEDFTKVVSGCDVVFDTVGGDVQTRSYSVLKPGGRLVWVAPAPDGSGQPRSDVRVLRPAVTRDRAHLERIVALLVPARSRPLPSRATLSRMPPMLIVSAKRAIYGASCAGGSLNRSARIATSAAHVPTQSGEGDDAARQCGWWRDFRCRLPGAQRHDDGFTLSRPAAWAGCFGLRDCHRAAHTKCIARGRVA